MDILRGPTVALAHAVLVPHSEFIRDSHLVTKKIRDLLDAVEKVALEPGSFTTPLADQVYLPIHYLLQKEQLEDLQIEYILLILSILLGGPWRKSMSLSKARQLFAVVTYLASPDPPGVNKKFLESSPELHYAAFRCLKELTNAAAASELANELKSLASLPHIVTILLDGLQHDAIARARDEALEALDEVLFVLVVDPDHLALLLPGVTSRLANLIGGLYVGSLHFTTRARAIGLLARLVESCMSDSITPSMSDTRTALWKTSTARQIAKTVNTIFLLLRSSGHRKISWAIFNFTKRLVVSCTVSLELCLPAFTDCLLYCASQHGDAELRSSSDSLIADLSKSAVFKRALELKLLELSESLVGKFVNGDDSGLIVALRAIEKGLGHLHGNRALTATVYSAIEEALVVNLKRRSIDQSKELARSVQQRIAQDLADEPRLGHGTVFLGDIGVTTSLSSSGERSLISFLQAYGHTTGADPLLDALERIRNDQSKPTLSSVRSFWIALQMFIGYAKGANSSPAVLYDFLDYAFQTVAVLSDATSPASQAQTALSLYALGELALFVGPSFREDLLDALGPVVDSLGIEQAVIVTQAKSALQKFAFICGYHSVKELILDNKDYIIDSIAQKLNTLEFSRSTPNMLAVLVSIAGETMIPYMNDLIVPLVSILDEYQGYSELVAAIFGVFGSIASIIASSFQPTIQEQPARNGPVLNKFDDVLREINSTAQVDDDLMLAANKSSVQEIQKLASEHADGEIDIESGGDDIDQPAEVSIEWNAPIPRAMYMVLNRVFEYADLFLTHKSPRLRFHLLKLMHMSTPTLAQHEDTFLPQIHKIWPVLVERFFDEEIYVAEAALECAGQISQYTHDFLSSRVDSVWPRLRRSRPHVFWTRYHPAHSVEGRYFDSVSEFLASVISATTLAPETSDSVIETFTIAIRHGRASSLMYALERVCADMLWLSLLETPLELPKPSGAFHPISSF